jgi:hypothetical protein
MGAAATGDPLLTQVLRWVSPSVAAHDSIPTPLGGVAGSVAQRQHRARSREAAGQSVLRSRRKGSLDQIAPFDVEQPRQRRGPISGVTGPRVFAVARGCCSVAPVAISGAVTGVRDRINIHVRTSRRQPAGRRSAGRRWCCECAEAFTTTLSGPVDRRPSASARPSVNGIDAEAGQAPPKASATAAAQLPYRSVTVDGAGHSPVCSRLSASPPRRRAWVRDQSYVDGAAP